MIKKLTIRNYALIEKAELSFGSNLNILSGETGSGKSMILSALDILLGARWTPKLFFNPDVKSVLEAHFEFKKNEEIQNLFTKYELDFDEETIIRRETTPSGKNRIFINDTPTTIQALKQISASFFNIHSQHQNVFLTEKKNQLTLIDGYLTEFSKKEFTEKKLRYTDYFKKYLNKKKELDAKQQELTQLQQESDYREFQLEELAKIPWDGLNEVLLEEKIGFLENQERINLTVSSVQQQTESEENPNIKLDEWQSSFDELKTIVPKFQEWSTRLNSISIELKDLLYEIQSFDIESSAENERLDDLHALQFTIENLKRKHQVSSLSELKDVYQNIKNKQGNLEHLEESIQHLKMEYGQAKDLAHSSALELHNFRKECIPSLISKVQNELKELSMPNARIFFELTEKEELSASGISDIEFLFAANKGFEAQKIQQVASGGEFARLSLVLQYILHSTQQNNTIVLDEIDTGVSGEVAHKMGKMMEQMALKSQVVCISHLAQVVSKGNVHFKVWKKDNDEKSYVSVKKLSQEERIHEIAQLLSGENVLESSLKTAKSLLTSDK
jgi:DNA repair protein RecN (Recombination protein N)